MVREVQAMAASGDLPCHKTQDGIFHRPGAPRLKNTRKHFHHKKNCFRCLGMD